MTPAEFAAMVPQISERIRAAVAVGVRESAHMIAEEAKRMIGHDQPEWPPLAASTVQRKGHSDPLLETGALRDSIDFVAEGPMAVIGSNDPKAIVHEHGDAHVPPRPFLSTAAMHKGEEIAELIGELVKTAIIES